MPRSIALLLLVAVLLSASGCGVKLIYNNADRLTRWWVSDYIDMNSEQREFLDASTAHILHWHRTTQLAIYRELLTELSVAVQQPTTEEMLQSYIDRIEQWGVAVNERAAPAAVQMLLSLTSEQLAEFEVELAKSNRKYAKEALVDPARQAREDAKDYASLLKRFIGRIDSEQRELIYSRHSELMPDAQVLYDYRLVWQSRLLAGLKEVPADSTVLTDLMINFDTYYTEGFARMVAFNEVIYRNLTLELLESLTVKQRNRLSSELREYADLCSELIADAAPVAPPAPAPAPLLLH